MKAYRNSRLCGDDEWLWALWPSKTALEFWWLSGDRDADRDGVVENAKLAKRMGRVAERDALADAVGRAVIRTRTGVRPTLRTSRQGGRSLE
jgi:hypothetical protein